MPVGTILPINSLGTFQADGVYCSGIMQPLAYNPLAQFLQNQHDGSDGDDEEPNIQPDACRSKRRVPVCLRSQFAISKVPALQRTGYGAYQVRLRLARDMHLAAGEPVL